MPVALAQIPEPAARSHCRRHGFRSLLSLGTTLLAVTWALSAHGAISQCQDEAGRTHFRQFDCPPGTRDVTPPARSAGLSVVVTTPLSAEEERALEQLEKSLARDRQQRARARARKARERSARAAEDARRCREAERKLGELAALRRKGYQATAEARLEAEEADWRAVRRDSC